MRTRIAGDAADGGGVGHSDIAGDAADGGVGHSDIAGDAADGGVGHSDIAGDPADGGGVGQFGNAACQRIVPSS
jgi:hypothetical protein